MIQTLRSEWFKLRTIRLHVWLPVGAVALLLVVVALVGILSEDGDTFDGSDLMSIVGGFTILVGFVVGVIAALGVASEFSHNTIRPTLAATPNRTQVFVAKAVLSAIVGLLIGIISVIAAYLLGSTIFTSRDASISLSSDDGSLAVFIGVPIFLMILAVFGYGVGLLLRNAPAAVAVVILWPLLLETILGLVLSLAGVDRPERVLPYSAGFQLLTTEIDSGGVGRVYGGVYFALFALGITVAGIVINNRRDV